MARWRYPSLSIHGIEGAFSESGMKSVIPQTVIGKFTIRLVPNQDPDKISQLVCDYLNEQWKARGSSNKMKVNIVVNIPTQSSKLCKVSNTIIHFS